jgi:hypothetical protein
LLVVAITGGTPAHREIQAKIFQTARRKKRPGCVSLRQARIQLDIQIIYKGLRKFKIK